VNQVIEDSLQIWFKLGIMQFHMDTHSLTESRTAYSNLLKASLDQIVTKLSALEEVERVSLFGSYARGRIDLLTDLDILVIMNTDKSFIERLRMLYGLLAVPVDLDLLCYTPDEWKKMRERAFFKRILQEEVVLYEKRRP
jgi:predicted nucleotidyltransferase